MAAVSRRDRHHALCVDLIEGHRRDGDALVVPVTVAVEVDYLVRAHAGTDAARAFLADLDEGRYTPDPVGPAALARAREIDAQYADADLGLVDATVVAVAEALKAEAIMTLDHEDFRLVKGTWRLIPEHVER